MTFDPERVPRLIPEPELFDPTRYPKLRRVVHDDRRGRIELLSVNETSDGFLIGQGRIGTGEDAYGHSVFIGRAADFR